MLRKPIFSRFFALSVFQIGFIFILPVVLLYFGLLPKETRLIVLGVFSCFALLLVLVKKESAKSLGFRIDNLAKDFLPYTIFTLLGIISIFLLAKLLGFSRITNWSSDMHFIFLFLPISALQEFLYRGFLMHELHLFFHSVFAIVFVNSVLFGFMHIIYPNALIMLPFAIISGVAFAIMYNRYPNLYLISISHALLNFTATIYSFFLI